ncbi:hypothetical protein VSH64_40655 [Amycolatopsis rhabdoformis]|uniref:Uncharacterized protein n=1 Tax=Amycolatopsis rhabdoformis TaxID=1448059 RepID=A0ABZ1I5N4_9PSEU|nr:hypothetical protein [Amycolatopsis rhabdoformis]WSE29066.1 hypothetical protein VSH64_40655 [Amycolatopsis rhabdoformis]
MSFDLAVWFAPAAVSAAEAKDRYTRLTNEDEGAVEHPQVAAFYRELTARHPELVDDPEKSPWTAGLGLSADAVVMTIAWSRAEAVARLVFDLARRHGLVAFDPQKGDVHNPAALALSSCDGARVENPDPAALRAALQRLSARNWHAVLERGDAYVQVGQGEYAGAPEGHYALEHRDGSPDRHYRTDVPSLDDVATAFIGFATHDPDWRTRFEWRKLDF